MKHTKLVIFTAVVTLCAFVAVISSSCHKDKCSGVICQNGGACSNGSCVCPTGYSGNFCENSTIVYQNDTYTPISINVNGTATTIPVNGSISYVGVAGSNLNITNTHTTNTPANGTYAWTDATDQFPSGSAAGVYTVYFDVDKSYFYLQLFNNDPYSITTLSVNVGYSDVTTDYVNIPSYDGNTYGIGYYAGYTTTRIQTIFSDGGSWSSGTFYIPYVTNATATVSVP